ncbi:hypothetical protein [Mucilaginibacter sp. UR6-11]|uniref:hypothetical protein n=1 Tax=Mucilaginibacter sp. UR6-11 TaxID=1435644 RepID=UPI001E63D932|nr:hypothetical protein [Mucilaginibacter sp. UR6-11]MCC8427292.1 hypothetical protein [Mucilaginibacter sp. UR6-11]
MSNLLIATDLELMEAFVRFASHKGYDASIFEDSVVIKDVSNKNNNFKIIRRDEYFAVYTICISKDDYEYSAKCMIYILLAEFNKSNGTSTHLHMNFKVDL